MAACECEDRRGDVGDASRGGVSVPGARNMDSVPNLLPKGHAFTHSPGIDWVLWGSQCAWELMHCWQWDEASDVTSE